ncbi:adenylate cyclase [Microvirga vignae]|uniref:Adenylate cyclase n=1 Tax=Microvirga vignae TaxID=1225564 RepID=A0A0H1R8M2_9HYPH|nr:DUF3095 domain-containing protein [Microvirga vignae]KLK91580.1 adenylate cyclase [Microvirga vignae]
MDTGGREADTQDHADFYARLPVFEQFSRLTEPAIYTPLPDGWVLGLSDIVKSTSAIAAGRYKEVNTAAASLIAALANRLGDQDFPFVFGGDGASFAVPPQQADNAREVLASVAAWAQDAFGFTLRVALVPVSTIRAEGYDVRIARFAASHDVTYAMFSGGGLAYAERRMKEGAFAVPSAPPGTWPDLTGLSCRFDELRSEKGIILSLIVIPAPGGDQAAFTRLVGEILSLADNPEEARRPIPLNGPPLAGPFKGFEIEAKTVKQGSLAAKAQLAVKRLIAFLIFKVGQPIGGFDPVRYQDQLVENTDFRKFDDGLRMTLDCTAALADRLESMLAQAQENGIARYGLHRQHAALMTCFVPSPTRSDHVHFVDGAMGGYAMAARALKPVA